MKLLSPASTNSKMAKNDQFSQYHSAILHLAPFNLSGINVCPAASKGCAMACLNTAGRGRFDNVQQARIRKTKLLFSNPTEFFTMLIKDITKLSNQATKLGKTPVVRLNGTSDLPWETMPVLDSGISIIDMFPNVIFYDYTKLPTRAMKVLPSNYNLTFSMSEVNEAVSKRVLDKGISNVAVVFRNKLPETYLGKPVIDGTTHDLRFLDDKGVIVGLLAKGKAKKDITGFVKE
jgi:hypothetical protein